VYGTDSLTGEEEGSLELRLLIRIFQLGINATPIKVGEVDRCVNKL
jgi:hypothetical protein